MAVKFVTDADGKGWLIVRYSSDGSTYPPLPQFLRVTPFSTHGGRDYFHPLEGRAALRMASVRRRDDGGSYLADGDPALPAGTITYVVRSGKLWYGGRGPVSVTTYPTNPVPFGEFDLEIPDEVHRGGDGYLSQSIYAGTWFRIGHSGDRYLHAGTISAGCATVTDVPQWTDIYNYLIRRRKGDGKSVGTIKVVQYSWEAITFPGRELIRRIGSLWFP